MENKKKDYISHDICNIKKFYAIGPINISLEGKNKIFELICNEFKPCEVNNSPKIDLEIKLVDSIDSINFKPKYFSGHVFGFDKQNLLVSERGYNYSIENLFTNEITRLIIAPKIKYNNILHQICEFPRAFLSCDFSNTAQLIKTSIMSYTLFWYVFHIILLKKNASFLHSAILDLNGEGMILTGTGGCGKTSTAFKFLEKQEYKYLSEDFGIIDDNGNAYFNPKVMAIYSTDVRYGQIHLKKFIDNELSAFDHLQWNFLSKTGGNPMRKVSPLRVLDPEQICQKTKIKNIYFLSRYYGNNILTEDISNEDLVERCLNASFRELKQLFEILSLCHSVGYRDTEFPTLPEIREKTKRIYTNAFKYAHKRIIYIPRKTSSSELVKIINNDLKR